MKTKSFILVAVAVFAALVGGVVYVALSGGGDERRAGALEKRSYAGANFALTLDGVDVGLLRSVSGCGVSAPVQGAGGNKHAGPVKYDACEVSFGLGMDTGLYSWITDALQGKSEPRSVSILQADATYKVVNELQLTNAVLTRFTVPALDAASKDPISFEVTIQPAAIQKKKGSGTIKAAGAGAKTKGGSAGSFRLTSKGIEQDLLKVNPVGSWSFEVPVAAGGVEKAVTGAAELGNLALTVAEPAPGFDTWLDELIKGKPSEKPMTVELLDPTAKTSLFELSFAATGIAEGELLGATESATDTIARRKFSLYVENATLKFN